MYPSDFGVHGCFLRGEAGEYHQFGLRARSPKARLLRDS